MQNVKIVIKKNKEGLHVKTQGEPKEIMAALITALAGTVNSYRKGVYVNKTWEEMVESAFSMALEGLNENDDGT